LSEPTCKHGAVPSGASRATRVAPNVGRDDAENDAQRRAELLLVVEVNRLVRARLRNWSVADCELAGLGSPSPF